MTCPQCGEKTTVIDTRASDDGVWRRRKCVCCGFKFNTEEIDANFYDTLQRANISNLKQKIKSATDSAVEKLKQLYNIL